MKEYIGKIFKSISRFLSTRYGKIITCAAAVVIVSSSVVITLALTAKKAPSGSKSAGNPVSGVSGGTDSDSSVASGSSSANPAAPLSSGPPSNPAPGNPGNASGSVPGNAPGTGQGTAPGNPGGSAQGGSPDAGPGGAISVSQSSISIQVGKMQTLTATVSVSEADKTIRWTTDNKDVVSINSHGIAVGKKAGTATIFAADNYGHTATCHVTVTASTDSGGIKPGCIENTSLNLHRNHRATCMDIAFMIEPY